MPSPDSQRAKRPQSVAGEASKLCHLWVSGRLNRLARLAAKRRGQSLSAFIRAAVWARVSETLPAARIGESDSNV